MSAASPARSKSPVSGTLIDPETLASARATLHAADHLLRSLTRPALPEIAKAPRGLDSDYNEFLGRRLMTTLQYLVLPAAAALVFLVGEKIASANDDDKATTGEKETPSEPTKATLIARESRAYEALK